MFQVNHAGMLYSCKWWYIIIPISSSIWNIHLGRDWINIWDKIFERNYLRREDLLDLIPNANNLIISKLYFGSIVETGTFNVDQRTRRLLCHLIFDTAKLFPPNASETELQVHEGDCWHHLCNVWIGSYSTHISRKFSEVLEQYFDLIHSSLLITTSLK